MAKFAKVGYGHNPNNESGLGRTKNEEPQGYTYIVNDNVRTGDIIQVVATSSSGRKFTTTGKTLHSYKETSVKGQEAKRSLEQNSQNLQEATKAYTGKELGVTGFRGRTKAEKLAGGEYEKGQEPQSKYTQMVRGGNIEKYLQQNPNAEITEYARKSLEIYKENTKQNANAQTFDEYSKKYMK